MDFVFFFDDSRNLLIGIFCIFSIDFILNKNFSWLCNVVIIFFFSLILVVFQENQELHINVNIYLPLGLLVKS